MKFLFTGVAGWLAIGLSTVAVGQAFAPLVALGDIGPHNGLTLDGVASGDLLGRALAADGDFNGDGRFDLAISAPGVDLAGGSSNVGAVYVLYGGRGALADGFDLNSLRAAAGGDGTLGFVVLGQLGGEFMGTSLSFVGDANGDGIDDLLIGSENLGIGIGGGGAYLIFGRPDSDPMPAELSVATLGAGADPGINSGFGVTFLGSQGRGRAGHAVAGVGDVNGDGVPDFLIGNDFPVVGVSSGVVGASYVLYGRRAGKPWPGVLNLGFIGIGNGDGSQGFTLLSNRPGNGLGSSVASLGDFTGDGMVDFALGSPFENLEAKFGGGAMVIAGRVSGPGQGFGSGLDLRNGTSRDRVNLLSGPIEDELLGESLAGVGDVNGDGHPDLAVSSSFSALGGARSGAVYVLFGRGEPLPGQLSFGELLSERGGDGSAGFVLSGGPGEQLGTAIVPLGDISGDGLDDFVVGAKGLAAGGAEAGGAYVILGRPAGAPFPARLDTAALSGGDGSLGFALSGERPFDQVGEAFAGGWDVNGDGGHDIIVGAPFSDARATSAGRIYILFGAGNGARQFHGDSTHAWFDPARPGEGVLTEAGSLDGQPALFVTWYTYQDGEQLWLAGGPVGFPAGAARVSTELLVTDGGEFGDAFDPAQISFQPWGGVELELLACDRLRWRYQRNDGVSGELEFVPLLPDLLDLPGCASGRKSLSFGNRLGRELSGTWWNPQRAGEGMVIDIEDRGAQPTAFFSWFTYAAGIQRWLVGSVALDPSSLELADIPLVVTGGARFGDAFDPAQVSSQPWGTATLRFGGCGEAVLEYSGQFDGGAPQTAGIALQRFTAGLYDFGCVDPQ